MARTQTKRHQMGWNAVRLVGNSNLNLAISYEEITHEDFEDNANNFNPDSGSWTASLWVYLIHTGISTDYNYSISILAQTDNDGGSSSGGGAGTGRNYLSSNVSTGQFSCNLGNVSRLSGFVPDPNTWYMVTLVRDKAAQTFQFFINDVAYNSFSSVASFESCTGKIRYGANRGTVRSMDGYVAKHRLIDGAALSQAQISSLYKNDIVTGTLEYEFLVSEGSGEPRDTGPNAYTNNLYNGATVSTVQSPFPERTIVSRAVSAARVRV